MRIERPKSLSEDDGIAKVTEFSTRTDNDKGVYGNFSSDFPQPGFFPELSLSGLPLYS